MLRSSCTEPTPAADQAARSASCFSAQERTLPRSMTPFTPVRLRYGVFSGILLVPIVHAAVQSYPPGLDLHSDSIVRHKHVPVKSVEGCTGDVLIVAPMECGQVHLHLVRDCSDTVDT